ncbi:hypothetical protein QM012_003518 [Aureobasidium pullulans]|uniref:Uncharacterized protein n=1 Tax=Aureobasidium pullulans TaxID=5580 RepID=A0ABR0T8N1_AURPU
MTMAYPPCPGPEAYIEAERESVQPAPPRTNQPSDSVTIRWMIESDYEFGSVWTMEILVFEPNERIFNRKTYEDDKIYWSQDTRTHLEPDATCASAGLHNGYRVFVTPEHLDSLDEKAAERQESNN